MKKRTVFVSVVVAVLAGIGAVQTVRFACSITAAALAYWGGWNIAESAQAAPWILFALAEAAAISLHSLHEESERYKRTGYGKIVRDHAHNPEYPPLRKVSTRETA